MPYKDRERQNKYMREWTARRRSEWFADKQCEMCGSRDDLEIHHVDPSDKVSHNIWSWSPEHRDAELAKCMVLCEACHREVTNTQLSADTQHGTYAMRWNHGCTCEACREYVRRQKRESRARING